MITGVVRSGSGSRGTRQGRAWVRAGGQGGRGRVRVRVRVKVGIRVGIRIGIRVGMRVGRGRGAVGLWLWARDTGTGTGTDAWLRVRSGFGFGLRCSGATFSVVVTYASPMVTCVIQGDANSHVWNLRRRCFDLNVEEAGWRGVAWWPGALLRLAFCFLLFQNKPTATRPLLVVCTLATRRLVRRAATPADRAVLALY